MNFRTVLLSAGVIVTQQDQLTHIYLKMILARFCSRT